MRYSTMAATRQHTVHVPRLDGGLNLDDIPAAAGDNQITDCRNLWWRHGALRARPGISPAGAMVGDYNITQPLGEGEMLCISYHADGAGQRTLCAALLQADGSHKLFGHPLFNYLTLPDNEAWPLTAFGCRAPLDKPYDWVFFLGSGEIVTYTVATDLWAAGTPYVPHISVDGAPTYQIEAEGASGTPLEPLNLLTGDALCTFTTDGYGHYFYLPAACRGCDADLELTLYNGVNKVVFDPRDGSTFPPSMFGLSDSSYSYVKVTAIHNKVRGFINLHATGYKPDNTQTPIPVPAAGANNLRVTVHGIAGDDPALICGMTMATWFGGDRSGIGGGTRLFLAGNSAYPNRLYWSQVDNPLYFPARNCAYVGDSGTPITALAKQSDQLILFKQHEIFCAEYVAGDDPTGGYDTPLANTYRAYFPLTPLHATVGCDCPHSLQLVNNKLVWMTSTGQLFMLTGVNRNSERNVRQISAMIAPALAAHSREERLAAAGGEYDGWYLLLVGNTMYVLDCRSTAFNSFSQYANETTALRALRYYRWEMPYTDIFRILSGGETPLLLYKAKEAVHTYRMGGELDGDSPIPVRFTTKMFGCADPTRRMSVPAMYLGLSDTQAHVRVTYHTDQGDMPDAAALAGNSPTPDTRRIAPRRLTPNIHHAARFGFTCESDAAFAVTDITINTRIDGK